MKLEVGDRIHNAVPSHYYKHCQGEVKEVTNTEIVVEYILNDNPVQIRHNMYDLKYFEKIS